MSRDNRTCPECNLVEGHDGPHNTDSPTGYDTPRHTKAKTDIPVSLGDLVDLLRYDSELFNVLAQEYGQMGKDTPEEELTRLKTKMEYLQIRAKRTELLINLSIGLRK